MLVPIAYVYEADTHCPPCAEKRFGRSERGFIAEHSQDSEGNPVGAYFPWNWEGDLLACGTCHEVIRDEFSEG